VEYLEDGSEEGPERDFVEPVDASWVVVVAAVVGAIMLEVVRDVKLVVCEVIAVVAVVVAVLVLDGLVVVVGTIFVGVVVQEVEVLNGVAAVSETRRVASCCHYHLPSTDRTNL
jgi:hypothetical protein